MSPKAAHVPPAHQPPVRAYVGLGANLGPMQRTIEDALGALGRLPGTQLVAVSALWRSAPVGEGADGPDYLNAVAAIDTSLTPQALLAHLHAIEADAGRQRPYPNAPRTLDLDLLLHGTARIRSATLTLPHPRMHERAFVLYPLAEIAPGLVTREALERVAQQQVQPLSQAGEGA